MPSKHIPVVLAVSILVVMVLVAVGSAQGETLYGLLPQSGSNLSLVRISTSTGVTQAIVRTWTGLPPGGFGAMTFYPDSCMFLATYYDGSGVPKLLRLDAGSSLSTAWSIKTITGLPANPNIVGIEYQRSTHRLYITWGADPNNQSLQDRLAEIKTWGPVVCVSPSLGLGDRDYVLEGQPSGQLWTYDPNDNSPRIAQVSNVCGTPVITQRGDPPPHAGIDDPAMDPTAPNRFFVPDVYANQLLEVVKVGGQYSAYSTVGNFGALGTPYALAFATLNAAGMCCGEINGYKTLVAGCAIPPGACDPDGDPGPWRIHLSGPFDLETSTNQGAYSFSHLPFGQYTITEVTQPGYIQCWPVGGRYSITIDSLSCRHPGNMFCNSRCPVPGDSCPPPPASLTCWYPFNENAGPTGHDVGSSLDLTFVPGNAQLWHAPGGCANDPAGAAVDLTTSTPVRYLVAATGGSAADNFGTGSFSIFAMIYAKSANDGETHTIIDKRVPSPDIYNPQGYLMYIRGGNLVLQLGHGNNTGYRTYQSPTPIPSNSWCCVGASVARDPLHPANNLVTLWVCNVPTPFATNVEAGNLNNSALRRVGEQCPGFLAGTAFNGYIDDLKLFRGALTPAQAGVACCGYCKCCTLPSVVCNDWLNFTGAWTTLRICNYTSTPCAFTWTIAGVPGCGTNNPPIIFSKFSGTSGLLNPGACWIEKIFVKFPPGFTASSVGCYQVTVRNSCSDECCSCTGKLVYSSPVDVSGWGTWGTGPFIGPAPPGDPVPVSFMVKNTGTTGATISYRLQGHSSDNDSTNAVVSLNGLPPGTPVFGTLSLAPGDSSAIDVQAVVTDLQPLNINEVVLSIDPSGGANYSPLTVAELESMTEEQAAGVPGSPPMNPPPEAGMGISATPNPFLERTGIQFSLANPQSAVRVGVFDLGGRLVRDLFSGPLSAGIHRYQWDGLASGGTRSPSGLYFIRVQAPGVLLKAKVVRME